MLRIIIIFVFLFAAPVQVFGATLSFRPILIGAESLGQAEINIFLDTDQSVNAVEGVVVVPESFAEDMSVSLRSTVVNFWLEEPHYEKEKGGIVFSGIIPGGVSGSSRNLFSFTLPDRAYQQNLELRFGKTSLFLNDGGGNVLIPETQSITLSPRVVVKETQIQKKDLEQPEDFVPYMGSSQNLFDGAHFIAFATTDKGSGIDRYEIKEGIWSFYREAASPYRLKDQDLRKNIWVRAIDREGNVRTVMIPAQHGVSLWEKSKTFGILLGGGIIYLIILLCRKLLRRS